jgi:hypothetical protein
MRIIRLQSAGRNSFLEIATLFRSLSDEDRQKLTREILRSVFPLRIDLLDPSKVFLTERSERRETPVDVHTTKPTRNERLQSAIRSALEEAFAISSKDVVDHLERLVKDSGAVDLLDLPVESARSLLLALCAVESIRSDRDATRLDVTRRHDRRTNGVFEANDYHFSQRT